MDAALGELARAYVVPRESAGAMADQRGVLLVERPTRRSPTDGEAVVRTRAAELGGGLLAGVVRRDPTGAGGELLATACWVPDLPALLELQLVLPPGSRFHYSNLAFALLGIVVERVSGVPYQDYVRERLFEPVGLKRVTFEPEPPAAKGYVAQPYADGVWDTIGVETGAWASAGQLWGTVGDICRWGAFLADPEESVLAPASAEEMRTVQAIDDHERWLSGYGLGLGLRRDGDRILAGHGGSMPGFIAQLLFSAKEKVVTALLTNESEADIGELAVGLLGTTVEEWPVAPETWRIGEPPPDDVVPLLGIWFMEAGRLVFRWREGKLEARFDGMPDWRPSSVLERETDNRWRIVSGPEHGEALRIERAEDGSVERMVLAGYPVTREPGPWRAPE